MIKFKKFSQKLGLFFGIFLTLFTPTTTFALSEARLDFFSQNNILFYDPEAVDPCYDMSAGNTNFEKIVKYFSGNNKLGVKLKAEAIAGLIANLKAESGLSAFRVEEGGGGGYGIAQFTPASKIIPSLQSDQRTSGYFNEYYNPKKYGHAVGESGIPDGVPPEVNDAWLAVQLDFAVKSEFKSTKLHSFRNAGGVMGLDYMSDNYTILEALEASKTASDAARMFIWIYERPADKPGGANHRSKIAEEILPKVKSSMNSSASSNKSSDGSNVTIIGDSITEGAKSKILAKLPKADIHSQVGKQFYSGSSGNPGGKIILENLVNSNQLRDTVVFALGTNGSITENQANEVYKLIGEKRHLIFVTNFTAKNDYLGNNNIFKKLQNDHKNVAIADWKSIIKSKVSTYLSSDGIHPNEEGQNLFSELIINTINEQGNNIGNCSIDGGLTKKQIKTLSNYYLSNKVSGKDLPSGKWNCVSLSLWFIRTFTSMKNAGTGNGVDVVRDLRNRYSFKTGTEPRPFSIFSVLNKESHPKFGHTGVVLAVKGDKIYTLEAAWTEDGSMNNKTILGEHKKSYFVNPQNPQDIFAYTDGILNSSELLKITGEK